MGETIGDGVASRLCEDMGRPQERQLKKDDKAHGGRHAAAVRY